MEYSWGVDLWDRLDDIINHTNVTSNFIDKFHKCFADCQQVWSKAAHKQKRLLEKLQSEINEPVYSEFTITTGLTSIINNFISIYNIKSTFSNSVAAANDEYFKKSHSQIKKQSSVWVTEKRKMEDELLKQRKKYDLSLKRYREKYQAILVAQDNCKKLDENKNLSRTQLDLAQQILQNKKDEFDNSKQDYAVEFRDFNFTQRSHFDTKVGQWTKTGESLYDQKLTLIKDLATQFSKLTSDMISKLNYSITRFSDVTSLVDFSKDAKLLVQKFKTGDVPPLDLQFIDMDYRDIPKKSKIKEDEFSDDISSDSDSTPGSDSNDVQTNLKNQTQTHSRSNSSIYASSYSHENRSEPIRSSVNSIKYRNPGTTTVNPEAKLSIAKSTKIFKSSTPWKNNPVNGANASEKSFTKQPSLYQRRGRNSTREPKSSQRSRSVSDMITTMLRSSLRMKSKDDKSPERKKNNDRGESHINTRLGRQSISDFDSDSDSHYESNQYVRPNVPDIVSTPAEALASFKRKTSAPDFQVAEQYYVTMNRTASPTPHTEYDQTDNVYQCAYVGSCTSNHNYDSDDPTNNYLSFLAGDQFYIVKMDDGSGWLYVDTLDQTTRGYVPSSYMSILHFDNASESIV